jgi:hypothetical protein
MNDLLIGVDFCACGPLNTIRCDGACRKSHINNDGEVVCSEKYRYSPPPRKREKKKEDRQ